MVREHKDYFQNIRKMWKIVKNIKSKFCVQKLLSYNISLYVQITNVSYNYLTIYIFFGGGVNVAFKHLRSYHDGACFLQWYFDQCAATQKCHAADTGHDTPPRHSIDTGPTCRCAIHWCGMSHWNTQLPILMSWVRPDREILPWPSTHTSKRSTLWCCYGGSQSEAQ